MIILFIIGFIWLILAAERETWYSKKYDIPQTTINEFDSNKWGEILANSMKSK